LALPGPVTAVALVLIIAGIADRQAGVHVRAASAVYVAFFLVAGKAYDTYWGLVAWPTWAMACGYGVRHVGEASLLLVTGRSSCSSSGGRKQPPSTFSPAVE